MGTRTSMKTTTKKKKVNETFFGGSRVNFKSKILGFLVVEEISSENLVPGDIIEIKNQSMMQCDVVLLNGSVILNESILTGESLPITN